MMKSETKGFIYAISGAFFFSFAAVIGKFIVTSGIHPFILTFVQYVFIVLILLAWHFWKSPDVLNKVKGKMHLLAFQGIIGSAGTNLFFYASLMYLDSGVTAMLLFLHPLLITIFFAITKIKHMNYQNYIAIFLALIGSMIVLDLLFIKFEDLSLFGIFLGLMAAVCYAFYNIFADLKLKEIEANSINLFGSLFGSLFTLVVIFVSNTPFNVSLSNMPSIFLLSSLSGILPVYFIFKSLKHIGSERVSVIMTLELPMTFLIAYIVFGDLIKVRQMAGIALIIFSTMLLHYEGKSKREVKNNEVGGL